MRPWLSNKTTWCILGPVCGLALFCAGLPAQQASRPLRATMKPSLVRLAPGAEQRFKVVLAATRLMAASAPEKVTWSVNDIPGGNAELGTIDANGLYRAPSKVPMPHEIHICAEAEGAANRRLWATVLMGNPDPAYKMVGSWAESTEKGGRLKKPHGISIDAGGNLLIADQGANRIFRYSKTGKFLAEIGRGPGSEAGQFTEPRYAAVDDSGNIFVTDVKGDRPRMQVFDPNGKLLRMFGEKGLAPGQILRGHGLAFDRKQRLFVTDVDNMRVCIFERSGKFQSCWGKDGPNPGDFNAPHGLFIDGSDDVFVNGYYGPTQKFTPDGDFLLAFGFGDPPDGAVYFHSIVGDRWSNVYATVRTKAGYSGALESQAGKKVSIAKYNNNGDFICNLSLSVKEHTESWAAVDRDGKVYALFTGAGQAGVEVFAQQ
jgi:DNA-binding beta-propeller fold protein YncE